MRRGLLPEGMLRRWPTMLVWTLASGLTTFQSPEFASTTILFAIGGVALALAIVALWGLRTRPKRNAFWILVHILLLAAVAVLADARPLMGAAAALPVALLWIHDSPASPTAMLSWGFILILWQPDFWEEADAEAAWNVALAAVVMIGAAQMERNRLARRQFAPPSGIWSVLRLGLVALLSLLMIAGREGLQAVGVFTYLGIDPSGTAGKITMLGIVAFSLAIALALWRVRPEKPPKPVVEERQVVRGGRETADPHTARIDFDDIPEDLPEKVDEATGRRPRPPPSRSKPASLAKSKPAPARKATKRPKKDDGPAKPGELDFD